MVIEINKDQPSNVVDEILCSLGYTRYCGPTIPEQYLKSIFCHGEGSIQHAFFPAADTFGGFTLVNLKELKEMFNERKNC